MKLCKALAGKFRGDAAEYTGHNRVNRAGNSVNWGPLLRTQNTVFKYLNLALMSQRFWSLEPLKSSSMENEYDRGRHRAKLICF